MARTPLVLTAGDIEVCRWLWMLRVLTIDQIRRLRYHHEATGRLSSPDNVRKRLKRLWDEGYLAGDVLQQTNERIYFLGERGLEALRAAYGLDQRRLYRPRSPETMQQLAHPLLVSECAVRFVESVRGSDVELPELAPLWIPFYHTHAVADVRRKKHIERYVTQEDLAVPGRPEPFRIRPDLVFALARGSAWRLFFLEADRGSESVQEIAQKQKGYHYFQAAPDPQNPPQRLWQRYGPARDFRVLFVTTTERRVEALRRQLEDLPGFELMNFAAIPEVQSRNVVSEPIWHTRSGVKALLR
jgi:Replication-relaxation